MNIINISIDGYTVTCVDSAANSVIATLILDDDDNVNSMFFNLSKVDMSLDDVLSLQNTIICAIKEMLNIKTTNVDTLFWSQMSFCFN